ncbi:hypothetical protein U9M48_001437 [Paspalum notatum var. saurae]|uniref:Uncharacterized protein n=1 Tax=Paspalum notatum var. saurae TaxID=547442 RepID=A0AAQ3PNR5_PASNO
MGFRGLDCFLKVGLRKPRDSSTGASMAYREEMTQRHGPEFNWRQADIDAEALLASGGGRRHGRYAFGTGAMDYDHSVSQARRFNSSTGSSRSSRTARHTRAEEEACAAREEAQQAKQKLEQLTQMTTYLASYVQDLTARLGPNANLPAFCPPQMSPQQGSTGWVPPPQGSQPPPGVDDGTPGLPATSVVDDGTLGLSATFGLDATAGLPATFGLNATAGLLKPPSGWMAPQGS